jgi:hypothetical protein
VIPSSDPIRHMFMPLTLHSTPVHKEIKRKSDIKDEMLKKIVYHITYNSNMNKMK